MTNHDDNSREISKFAIRKPTKASHSKAISRLLFINKNTNKHHTIMKKFKFGTVVMAALIILSSCGASNTTKGGLIGGGGGAAVGALIGISSARTLRAHSSVQASVQPWAQERVSSSVRRWTRPRRQRKLWRMPRLRA